jgi:hypothetical protein
MMGSPKIYGYGVAVVCAVIATVHAPGLTHHLHWKATVIWGVVGIAVAVGSALLLDKTRALPASSGRGVGQCDGPRLGTALRDPGRPGDQTALAMLGN